MELESASLSGPEGATVRFGDAGDSPLEGRVADGADVAVADAAAPVRKSEDADWGSSSGIDESSKKRRRSDY